MYAQTAEVVGAVHDSSGATIPKASVEFRNQDTGIRLQTKTNSEGQYHVAGINPGKYNATVEAKGFRMLTRENILFQVGDKAQIDFGLKVGNASETVTVDGSGETINTTDATVGTVIDSKFVQDIPLNGRSFQSLILLTPGVVTTTPQGNYSSGQYVANGLPSDGSNHTLDGASASSTNVPAGYQSNLGGAGVAGMTANATSLGTTQALIGIDALQEFKISTSTYSAEFGRQPGAQISFQSRSGTNEYHGVAFDYLRNVALDANNWFNDYTTPITAKPAEHQNDFGGVFGGPLGIPGLYAGKDRSFFFFSYEGLRVTVPGAVGVAYVPSNGTYNTATYASPLLKNMRGNAPAVLRPWLNSFPLPNCSTAQDPQCIDHADGQSPALITQTTLGSLDAIAGRIDFQATPSTRIFARYTDTTSSKTVTPLSNSGGYAGMDGEYPNRTRVYLLGVNSALGASVTNELRLQWSPTSSILKFQPTSYGGATPTDLFAPAGVSGGTQELVLSFPGSGATYQEMSRYGTRQFQPNFVETVTWQHGRHLFKAGANYVQTKVYMGDGSLSPGPETLYTYFNGAHVLSNTLDELELLAVARQDPTFKNLGVFFQDEWRLHPRLSLSLGLRWDLSPSPSVSGAPARTYAGDLNNLASLTLAPAGTPIYATDYANFAPRFGLAAVIHNEPGHELVFRAGGGVFYGTGQSFANVFGNGHGLGSGYEQLYTPYKTPTAIYPVPMSYPTPPSAINNDIPPIASPYALGFIVARDYTPPKAIQWSVSLEQAIGKAQSVTFSYVGTDAPQLGHWAEYSPATVKNSLFGGFEAFQNGPGSEYNSLQVQYKRQAFRGLQVLAGYTWSHSIDSNSTDYSNASGLPLQRGNSDNDVRNNFNAALVYNLPSQYASIWQRAILGGWSVDMRLAARTAFPVQIQGAVYTDSVTGEELYARLNYNGQNPYVYKPGIPGGRQFNPAVFSVPAGAEGGNGDAPRNFLRGFGYSEADVSLQRRFPIHDEVSLLFRTEAFNITNHPAFGAVSATCGVSTAGATCSNTLMGQATATLSNSLSGLSSLYQQGGPRSLQLALKLQF
jgi:hypothetical protein